MNLPPMVMRYMVMPPTRIVAALYVEKNGVYSGLTGVDPWDIERDARKYAGPYPVVAHPPCERWGGPSCKVRKVMGDDNGCFAAALSAVQKWGGVLEHPEGSHAWRYYGIPKPPKTGGWIRAGGTLGDWTCCVEQGHYGHVVRKATWLYCCCADKPPELIWGPAKSTGRFDAGYHSAAERAAAKVKAGAAWKDAGSLPKSVRNATPKAFRVLLSIARLCQ